MMTTETVVRKPIKVFPSEVGPYFVITESRLAEVQNMLNAHNIVHQVDDIRTSMNDGPFRVTISFPIEQDAEKLQSLVDSTLN